MIHSLFLLRENGVCVFEHHWVRTVVDAQIFSGFITALSSFAIESMGENLQSLKLIKDQRLAILKHHRSPIIGVIIADVRDNGYLLNKILRKILERFYWLFRKDRIQELIDNRPSRSKDLEEEESSVYEEIPDDVWTRD